MAPFAFDPIGTIRSCYTEKFGTPRQPGLVPQAVAWLDILPAFQNRDAFRGLEAFSHIWIVFVFHQCLHSGGWRPTVRPPRLGGNRRIGVYASRSGFRPNPIGQSVVELEALEMGKTVFRLHLKGIDLIDGTPVLDIKPYLVYADSVPAARCSYAQQPPEPRKPVRFLENAFHECNALDQTVYPDAMELISAVLSMDPRPGYRSSESNGSYGLRLWDLNIRFRMEAESVVVQSVTSGAQD